MLDENKRPLSRCWLVPVVLVVVAMVLPTVHSSSSIVTPTTTTTTTSTCGPSTCLNGGICNQAYPDYGEVCQCHHGFTGPRCGDTTSSSSGSSSNGASSSSCTLDCANGGVCLLGMRPASELADVYRFWDHEETSTEGTMYCDCPDNWDGPTCKVSRVSCGEHHCFHGAECLTRSEGGREVHRCDCNTAHDADNSLYAGQFCQYPATAHCQAADDMRGTSDIFCVNDGTCRTNVHEGCNCPEGLSGFSCEFRVEPSNVQVVSQSHMNTTSGGVIEIEESHDFGRPVVDSVEAAECSLQCANGGTCRHGQKEPDEAWEVATNHTTHLESAESIDETFAHCVCPPNFAGALCEHPVDTCGADNGKFLCLHGSKCVDVGSEQLCDCDQAVSSLATFFAGNHCQHPVNDVCTEETPGGSTTTRVSKSSSVTLGSIVPGTMLAFCVNGGECAKRIAPSEPHPGCSCLPGFLGPHCELRESPEVPSLRANDPYANNMNSLGDDFYPEEEEKKSNSYAVAFWILFVSLATGLLCVLVHRYRRRRLIQKNAAISSSLQWTPAYKDRASNEINIAPGSSYSDVYEEATREAFGRSSRDPMVTAVGAATSVSALQLEQKVSSPEIIEHDTDGDDFPDDLRSEPKIDIGPPIDEDGNELHNVEIV